MEEEQILDDGFMEEKSFGLTTEAENNLKTAAQWAEVIAYAGFFGLIVKVISLLKMVMMGLYGFPIIAVQLIWLLVSFFIFYSLMKFAKNIKKGPQSHVNFRTIAFENLNSYFKILGIIVIFMLIVGGLIFVLGGLAGIG